MPLTDLQWLRKLVNDVPAVHHELAMGDGITTAFQLATGAATAGSVAVTVDDIPKILATDYQINSAGDGIVFLTAPADESHVRMVYVNTTWDDDTLETFLAAGANLWVPPTEQVPMIYQAALYAIDTTLMGLAAALNFGAGAEQFDMVSVFNRMMALRAMWALLITTTVEENGLLSFVDIELDLFDPSPLWAELNPINPTRY